MSVRRWMAMALAWIPAFLEAPAVEIWNGTNLLFDARGFEFCSSVTTGSYEAQLAAGVGTDNDPDGHQPASASYTISESTNFSIQATSAPFSDTDPGPAEGLNYVRVKRGGGSSLAGLAANFPAMQTDGVVRLEFMIFPSNSANHCFNFHMRSGSTMRLALLGNLNGNVQYSKGGTWYNTGLHYVSNQWQAMTVEYAPNASTFSFSIAQVATDNVPVSAAGTVNNFSFGAAANFAKFYLDAVTHPRKGTLLLIY